MVSVLVGIRIFSILGYKWAKWGNTRSPMLDSFFFFFFLRNKTGISLNKINHGRLTIQNRGVEEHPPSTPLNPQHDVHVLQGCEQ